MVAPKRYNAQWMGVYWRTAFYNSPEGLKMTWQKMREQPPLDFNIDSNVLELIQGSTPGPLIPPPDDVRDSQYLKNAEFEIENLIYDKYS